jgi:hypothetical protein
MHSWWVAEANLTANRYADKDEDPLADTDDDSLPTMNLVYSILETLHTHMACLEKACVKS